MKSGQVFLIHIEAMKADIEFRLAVLTDLGALEKVGETLFDHAIKRERAIEFLNDPRHHLVLAFHKGEVVGMASGVHYVHPDKDPSMFINEVGILDDFQNCGIGRELVKYLWGHAKGIGCASAWVATEKSNIPAQRCYIGAGAKPDDEPFLLFEFEGNG